MTRLLVVLACSVWRVPSGLLQPQPVCTVGSSYLPALSCVWTSFLPSWFMIDIIPKLCSSAQRWHATQVAAAQQPQEVDGIWQKMTQGINSLTLHLERFKVACLASRSACGSEVKRSIWGDSGSSQTNPFSDQWLRILCRCSHPAAEFLLRIATCCCLVFFEARLTPGTDHAESANIPWHGMAESA